MHERQMEVAGRIRLYMRPFTTRNQAIKTPKNVDQAIKQASRDESNDQAPILTIKFLDRCRRWKYGTHSSDYPLNLEYVTSSALQKKPPPAWDLKFESLRNYVVIIFVWPYAHNLLFFIT